MSRFNAPPSGPGPGLPEDDVRSGLGTPAGHVPGISAASNRWTESEVTARRPASRARSALLAAVVVLPLAAGISWVIGSGALDDPYGEAMEAGRIAVGEDRSADALEAFRTALHHRPEAFDPAIETAVVLFGMGQFAESAAWCDRALGRQPGAAAALNLRGLCRYHLGNSEGARTDFLAALASAPDYPAPRLNLANILVEREDRIGAIRELETFLAQVPDFEQAALVRENLERLRRGRDTAEAAGDPG